MSLAESHSWRRPTVSRDGDDLGDFGHLFADVAFDAHLQGHGAAGAPVAGAVEADLHHTVGGHIDEFDVPAVRLHGRSDQVDDVLHLFLQRRRGGSSGGHGYLLSARSNRTTVDYKPPPGWEQTLAVDH